jgi:hypothetical protein
VEVARVLADDFELLLARYGDARTREKFGKNTEVWKAGDRLQKGLAESQPVRERLNLQVEFSAGRGNWAAVPWIALLDGRETDTTRRGLYCVYLFREDMSGVYLTFMQGVTESVEALGRKQGRPHLRERAEQLSQGLDFLADAGFSLDEKLDLRTRGALGVDYQYGTVAYKLYLKGEVPDDETLLRDLEACLRAYDAYLEGSPTTEPGPRPTSLESEVEGLISAIGERGFVYEPWQVAAFVAAVRTKPFVILAGITGTGKSKLPAIVAEITGAQSETIPVRPDWTDSSDVLGYADLQGRFRPGAALEVAARASRDPDREWFCIVDEMNLARVEQYFAEVLSRMEDRRPAPGGGFATPPLLSEAITGSDSDWANVGLSPNLVVVGTVNMDESSQTFSRKVLDRAFTLELSDVDLASWRATPGGSPGTGSTGAWPTSAWYPRAASLPSLQDLRAEDERQIEDVVRVLTEVNRFLSEAQLQVGYRTRDEAALFVLNAADTPSSFVDRAGRAVDPIDLVLNMKVLPRIIGGSGAIRATLLRLLGWAVGGSPFDSDSRADDVVSRWDGEGRPGSLAEARYPRTAARLCLMWERLQSEGFTSYWL